MEWRTSNLQTSKAHVVEWRTSYLQTSKTQIALFRRVAAFTTCPLCQCYQCSSLNRILCVRHGFRNMSTLSILPVFFSQLHPLDTSRLSQHVHIVNITSVLLSIAPFGHVTAFATCPHCQYYQCSSLNCTLWTRHGFRNMSTLSILPVFFSQLHPLDTSRLSKHVHIVNITCVCLLIGESRDAPKRHPLDFCEM